MGWAQKSDNIPFVLPMDYHLQEPFLTLAEEKRKMLARAPVDLICLENGDNEAVSILAQHRDYRGFHVIRDPRDVIVSGYFSHRYSHRVNLDTSPWLYKFREHLARLPDLESGLLAEIEFSHAYMTPMHAWNYENPHVLELRFEELTAEPTATFLRIFEFFNVSTPSYAPRLLAKSASRLLPWNRNKQFLPKTETLPRALLQWLIWRNRFERRSGGRRQGEENPEHHYRKGIPGDWRNYFTPRVKDAFKQRYPNLVPALGYEATDDW
jgi:hypothetical protein